MMRLELIRPTLLLLLLWCHNNNAAASVSSTHRQRPLAAVLPTSIVKNLAKGSFLKCAADLSGGLPLEVWKSSVVLDSIERRSTAQESASLPPTSFDILQTIVRERGFFSLWSGLTPRMAEGLFSGSVLLAAKEGIHTLLSKNIGFSIPPSIVGFLSGAGGGAAQALVMGPTSLLVTACVAASNSDDGDVSTLEVVQRIIKENGILSLYRGAPAVAARQATNWASRQGFTEFVRPRIPIEGVAGELLAGCIGGTLSAWNTPFEVARIESQSQIAKEKKSLITTMREICDERGVEGLYVGLIPRACQACYQTLFLVCVPRLLN